jgi:GNAT superfamily N-acetyltransferase
VTGDRNQDQSFAVNSLQALRELEPIDVWQGKIEKRDVGRELLGQLHAAVCVVCRIRDVAGESERVGKQVGCIRLVVDDQDSERGRRCCPHKAVYPAGLCFRLRRPRTSKTPYAHRVTYSIRVACESDIAAMKAIRDGVRENALVSTTIEHADYVRGITVDGRAWVCIDEDIIVGFACGRLAQRDIWALFLRASHEGRGRGNALMDVVERWMFDSGVTRIELTTEPGTRAERLYRRRGWVAEGTTASGELRFALTKR